jgi:hypothetical protein
LVLTIGNRENSELRKDLQNSELRREFDNLINKKKRNNKIFINMKVLGNKGIKVLKDEGFRG